MSTPKKAEEKATPAPRVMSTKHMAKKVAIATGAGAALGLGLLGPGGAVAGGLVAGGATALKFAMKEEDIAELDGDLIVEMVTND